MGKMDDYQKIHDFKAEEPGISVWGDTGVAGYGFEIDWEENGQRKKDPGKEIFVFRRESGLWLAVWRLLLPADEGSCQGLSHPSSL